MVKTPSSVFALPREGDSAILSKYYTALLEANSFVTKRMRSAWLVQQLFKSI